MRRILIVFLLIPAFHLIHAQELPSIQQQKPFVLGTTIEIRSKELAENRVLNIYLPDGYEENDSLRYPVIYLLDGSADEDFIHVAGLVQFCTFPWVNILPHSIVVGIANIDRKRDFTFPTAIEKDKKDFPTSGQSMKFIRFIESELQPFIDKNYRTSRSKTIIGQSLGGLLATEILYTKPKLFSGYIIVSPSLWWNNGSLLSTEPVVLQPGFSETLSLFIGVGKEGKIMESDTRKLVSVLKDGNKKNITVHFEYFKDENHASILHNAIYKAFEGVNSRTIRKQ